MSLSQAAMLNPSFPSITLNSFQGPWSRSLKPLNHNLECRSPVAEWMLKRVQHDGARAAR